MLSHLPSRQAADAGLGLGREGEWEHFAFRGAGCAAVQRSFRAVFYRYQVIGAEGVAAAVTGELIAAWAQQLAAGPCAGFDFQQGIARSVFVVVDRKTFKEGIAGGAGSAGELLSHA